MNLLKVGYRAGEDRSRRCSAYLIPYVNSTQAVVLMELQSSAKTNTLTNY